MKLSVVIVTHNRPEALRRTLSCLAANPCLPHGEMEILVVDNASPQTLEALPDEFAGVSVIRRKRNEGVSARNHAFNVARGKYLLLVDDDSHPLGDAVERSMAVLDARPSVGAVVGRVELPDGTCEASALPGVIINCAVVLRKTVIDEVGGFPREFFRQAEEYDLSLRLWQAGYSVERCEDLVYRHEKVAGNRWPAWIHRLDIRNNLIVLHRYLPADLRREYERDWTQRYTALARHAGHPGAAALGRWQARAWVARMTLLGRELIDQHAVEAVFELDKQRQAVADWASRRRVRRVAVADFGKNLYATFRACREAGLDIAAIHDCNPAFAGLRYRGIGVTDRLPDCDGVVLANVNPAHVDRRLDALRQIFAGPVLRLWHPRVSSDLLCAPAAAPVETALWRRSA